MSSKINLFWQRNSLIINRNIRIWNCSVHIMMMEERGFIQIPKNSPKYTFKIIINILDSLAEHLLDR